MPVNLITASIANIAAVKDIKRELDSKEKFEYKDSHKIISFENIEIEMKILNLIIEKFLVIFQLVLKKVESI